MCNVGTAGWSIPSVVANEFGSDGTYLERYAACFPAVEINSSFYRSHRRATYAKWAASVPTDFRFSLKLPKAITHENRFNDCTELIERFAEESAGLGSKRALILVQLPPSFAYPGDLAERFLTDLQNTVGVTVVLEPRHVSWFMPEVDGMLRRLHVPRVAADPAKLPVGLEPGGWDGLAYFRLHGSPRIYASSYDQQAITEQVSQFTSLVARGIEVWAIYDNTMYGAATVNALQITKQLRELRILF